MISAPIEAPTELNGVLLHDLYLSKQPMMFVLIYFTLYFTFRSARLVALLLSAQIVVSACTYAVLIDDSQHRLSLWQPAGAIEQPLASIAANSRSAKNDARVSAHSLSSSHLSAAVSHAKRQLLASDASTSDDIDGDQCTVYRLAGRFGTRHVFTSSLDADDSRRATRDRCDHGPLGSIIDLFRQSNVHSHYVTCRHRSGVKIAGITEPRKRSAFTDNDRATSTVTSKSASVSDDQRSSSSIDDHVSTFAVSVYTLVAIHAGYSAAGALLAAVVAWCNETPPLFGGYTLRRSFRHTTQFVELAVLFASFLYVDEYIAETQFPVGIFRSFLLYTGTLLVIYFTNRNESNVRASVCERSGTYEYDLTYLHWLQCSTSLFSSHFALPFHAYVVTLVAVLCVAAYHLIVLAITHSLRSLRATRNRHVVDRLVYWLADSALLFEQAFVCEQ